MHLDSKDRTVCDSTDGTKTGRWLQELGERKETTAGPHGDGDMCEVTGDDDMCEVTGDGDMCEVTGDDDMCEVTGKVTCVRSQGMVTCVRSRGW